VLAWRSGCLERGAQNYSREGFREGFLWVRLLVAFWAASLQLRRPAYPFYTLLRCSPSPTSPCLAASPQPVPCNAYEQLTDQPQPPELPRSRSCTLAPNNHPLPLPTRQSRSIHAIRLDSQRKLYSRYYASTIWHRIRGCRRRWRSRARGWIWKPNEIG
jgi:hypothetical protein